MQQTLVQMGDWLIEAAILAAELPQQDKKLRQQDKKLPQQVELPQQDKKKLKI